jgi:hypothetical protein
MQFRISPDNQRGLDILAKYAQMLDFIAKPNKEDELSIDGVVNEILDDVIQRRLKGIVKRWGFFDVDDLLEKADDVKDGEEMFALCQNAQKDACLAEHTQILKHVPIEDRQGRLAL